MMELEKHNKKIWDDESWLSMDCMMIHKVGLVAGKGGLLVQSKGRRREKSNQKQEIL